MQEYLPASRRLKVAWAKFTPMKRNQLLPTLVFGLSVLGALAQDNPPGMARIPAGTFEMGDHHGFVDPKHGGDETPLHQVRLDGFFSGINDVTTREYCAFLNSALAQQQRQQPRRLSPATFQGPRRQKLYLYPLCAVGRAATRCAAGSGEPRCFVGCDQGQDPGNRRAAGGLLAARGGDRPGRPARAGWRAPAATH